MPTRWPVRLNLIPSLPIIQVNNLLHSQQRDDHSQHHNHPLLTDIPNAHKRVSDICQEQPNHIVQEPNREPLRPELKIRSFVEENELVRILVISDEHRHSFDDVMHRPGYAEEVHQNDAV